MAPTSPNSPTASCGTPPAAARRRSDRPRHGDTPSAAAAPPWGASWEMTHFPVVMMVMFNGG